MGDGQGFLGIASATNSDHTVAWFSKAVDVQPVTGLNLNY
jgi:hypothetical protein